MKIFGTYLMITSFLTGALLFVSCQKEAPQQPAQPSPVASQPAVQPGSQPAVPANQPAQTATAPAQPPAITSGKLAGPAATEKHQLYITNYAATAVTVSLNGGWIGQWDANSSAPLDTVVQGKNELTVELADQPKGQLTVEVNAKRNGEDVNLLRLNFQGKAKGVYTYYFAAR